MRIPATVGPTTDAIWKFSWPRAIAAGRRSRATSRGMAEDRDELEQRQRRDRERRPGQNVDLVRQGKPGDLRPDPVDRLPGPEPTEVAVQSERRDVEEEPSEPTRGRRHLGGRSPPWSRLTRSRTVWPCVANPASL